MLPCDAGRAEVVHPGPATAPRLCAKVRLPENGRYTWQRGARCGARFIRLPPARLVTCHTSRGAIVDVYLLDGAA
jgi:hypothetical protein